MLYFDEEPIKSSLTNFLKNNKISSVEEEKELRSILKNGFHDVYSALCPYMQDVENERELIWELCISTLEKRLARLAEAI